MTEQAQPPASTTSPPAEEYVDQSGGKWIPYQRFAAVIAERDTARKAAEAAGTATAKAAQLERELTGAREEATLARAGWTDPEAVELARLYHGKLPEESRPDLVGWLGQLRSDPGKAPKALTPWLARTIDAPTPVAASSAPTAAQPVAQPATTTTAQAPATAGAAATPSRADVSRLQTLTERMARGDRTARAEFEELRKRGELR
ncbi:MAG: hypothetical protein RIS35_543 [Pseudomonadota bacterium]